MLQFRQIVRLGTDARNYNGEIALKCNSHRILCIILLVPICSQLSAAMRLIALGISEIRELANVARTTP